MKPGNGPTKVFFPISAFLHKKSPRRPRNHETPFSQRQESQALQNPSPPAFAVGEFAHRHPYESSPEKCPLLLTPLVPPAPKERLHGFRVGVPDRVPILGLASQRIPQPLEPESETPGLLDHRLDRDARLGDQLSRRIVLELADPDLTRIVEERRRETRLTKQTLKVLV